MKITNTYVKNASHFLHNRVAKQLHLTKACCIATLLCAANLQAATTLADKPLFSGNAVPGNVAIVVSAEFPTVLGSAYTSGYSKTTEYLGYWDANKCYAYNASTEVIQGPYNTGVNNSNVAQANGSDDSHWVNTTKPATVPVATDVNNVNNFLGSPAAGDTDSAYIGVSGTNAKTGNYSYRTTFNIPTGKDPTKTSVSFRLYADDKLVSIFVGLNNTGISSTTINGTTSGLITLPEGTFTTNTGNTITITVNNTTASSLAGLRIDDMKTVVTVSPDGSYFKPMAVSAANHVCNTGATKYWSGNFLNWALTQTIDPFRSALSGGYRAVDKTNLTILEKAWATGQGGTVAEPTITTNQPLIAESTPFQALNDIKIRINGLGNKFYITSTGDLNTPGTSLVDEGAMPTAPIATKVYQLFARTEVCNSSLLENNCTKYPNGYYKPTGQFQKNALKLNFAAFGYLKDDNLKRDGGVLRAKMAPLGPKKPQPGSTEVANVYPSGVSKSEWNETTGIFAINPDSEDATGGITQSGVINYLNKFGLAAQSFKTYDPVGELYYTAIRYFKNQGNVAAYTSGADATMIDGFPVINFAKATIPGTGDDPVKYACQANFIIGIGDTNTHADSNLPGSTINTDATKEPTLPTEVANDTSVNSYIATNKVGELENIAGYTNLGAKYTPWCCNNNSFLMAGIAYDSHTKDMRSDFPGKQVVETYWLDVLESGDRKDSGVTGMRNQFWLAAKYGGFDVSASYDPYAATTGPATALWDKNGAGGTPDGDPDNYFRANNPKLMIDGLNKAFDDIVSKVSGSANAFAPVSSNVFAGDLAFATSFDTDGWTGSVVASRVTFDAAKNNDVVTTQVWTTADAGKAGSQNWDTGRFIATAKCSTVIADGTKSGCVGVPFRLADISTTNVADLALTGDAQKALNFLRGDRSNEGGTTGFRIRNGAGTITPFGDIVNSKVIVVGKPNASYKDSYNPGYSAFKTAKASRTNMAYVGANDGMLHAINATNTTNGGKELFAYVPNDLFNGPNATPLVDGLSALTKQAFIHHQYVDATVSVRDVNFGANSADWHSLLVGGLGKGGKSFYAIDVTNPDTLTNETALKAAVKWEFSHNDMGYSFGKPVMVKINNTSDNYSGWAVILTSGYNTADKNGYFFIVNPSTGALIKKIPTYATAPSSDAGLAQANAFLNDADDFTADAAYAGDLLGNVWRLNLKDFTVTNLAQLKSSGGVPQPITTQPQISTDNGTGNRIIFVGTGKLLDDSDAANSDQSVYAITDGSANADGYFQTTGLPSGVSFPIVRSKLNDNSTLYKTTGVVSPTANTVGWYIDLEDQYRININMANNAGTLYFVANKTSSDACAPSGTNRQYAVSYVKGRSLYSSAFIQSDNLAKSSGVYKNELTGEVKFAVSDDKGNLVTQAPSVDIGSDRAFRQLNWRDLPTAD